MKNRGFTIVELLIVIVVIGILAAITVVAFNGVRSRVIESSMKSDIAASAKLLANDYTINTLYPSSSAAANSGRGLPLSNGSAYTYTPNNATSPPSYTLTITNAGSTNGYSITNLNNNPTVVAGGPVVVSGSSDTFNRADASSLGTASNGQVWNILSGASWNISGNKVLQNEGAGLSFRVVTLPSGLSDATVTVDLVLSLSFDGGLALRVQDDNNYIFVDVSDNNSGTFVTKTFRKSGTTFTGLTTLATLSGMTYGSTVSLKAVMAGSTITIYINSGSGYAQVGQSTTVTGLESFSDHGLVSASNQNSARFDNFLVVP